MSELSPLSASRLGELALEAGIPAGVLNIVHGLGVETGEPLCSHPDVRAISFTGSTATGDRIVRPSGLNLLFSRSWPSAPSEIEERQCGEIGRASCRERVCQYV